MSKSHAFAQGTLKKTTNGTLCGVRSDEDTKTPAFAPLQWMGAEGSLLFVQLWYASKARPYRVEMASIVPISTRNPFVFVWVLRIVMLLLWTRHLRLSFVSDSLGEGVTSGNCCITSSLGTFQRIYSSHGSVPFPTLVGEEKQKSTNPGTVFFNPLDPCPIRTRWMHGHDLGGGATVWI